MRPRYASCERRSASSCSSWTREKNWQPCPGNPRPPSDGAGPDAHGGEGGGDRAALSVVRRTTVDFLLPGRTAAESRTRSRSRRARRQADRSESGIWAASADGADSARAARSSEPQADSSHSEGERVADLAAPPWPASAGPGLGLAGRAAERSVGHRCDPRLLWSRRLVSPDSDH